jgi:hypothetical protein
MEEKSLNRLSRHHKSKAMLGPEEVLEKLNVIQPWHCLIDIKQNGRALGFKAPRDYLNGHEVYLWYTETACDYRTLNHAGNEKLIAVAPL